MIKVTLNNDTTMILEQYSDGRIWCIVVNGTDENTDWTDILSKHEVTDEELYESMRNMGKLGGN